MSVDVYALRPDMTVAGRMTRWQRVETVERWRQPGRWQVVVDDADEAQAVLDPGGGLLVVDGDTVLLSGGPDHVTREQAESAYQWVISGWDHNRILADLLAWPEPGEPITQQSVSHDVRTGPAETVLLGFIADNAARAVSSVRPGVHDLLVVPESQGRGPDVTVRGRFHSLLQVARRAVTGSDLGFRVVWQDRQLTVDVWEAQTVTAALFSDQAGTLLDWATEQTWPEATRAVVGGGGQGADRVLTDVFTADSLQLEEDYRMRAERFVDQRQTTELDELDQAGWEVLEDGRGGWQYRVQLPDVAVARYGVDVRVGDRVTVYPGGVPVTDRVTEATTSVSADGGRVVALRVGPETKRERDARRTLDRIGDLERST